MMQPKYSIIITDDHQMVASGLKSIINEHELLNVIDTAHSGAALLHLLKSVKPDLIILDMSMPDMNGIETAKAIRKKYKEQKILCISTFYEKSMQIEMELLKVQGFVPKLSDSKTLIDVILDVLNNKTVFIIPNNEIQLNNKGNLNDIANKLSRREKEIMGLIKQRKTTKEISELLFLSTLTVDTHRKNICKKLQVKNALDLYKVALDLF
jgi:DNA-binding NarL/FixJ family response regulator